LLKQAKIPHKVLNARYHEQEAHIIADAGDLGAVTIATNMAGRGTDIKLGGNLEMRIEHQLGNMEPGTERDKAIAKIKVEIEAAQEKVKEAGGLYVIGTERHESRRIDNQLRGRSGRQGDPGASKFFISLEDDLMRIFGSEKLDSMLRKLGVQEGEAISHTWISKALERAQQKVEARNFDIRKHLLRYDDVMNDQRKIIYEQRRELMQSDDISEMVNEIKEEVIETVVRMHASENVIADQWDLKGFHAECVRIFALDLPLQEWAHEEGISEAELRHRVKDRVFAHFAEKEEKYTHSMMRLAEKTLLLRLLDQAWKDHLLGLDHLRQGINLRAYAQSNPLNEYKREAFNLFQYMLHQLKSEYIAVLSHFDINDANSVALESILPNLDFSSMEETLPDWTEDSEKEEDASKKAKPKAIRKKAAELDPKDPTTWGKVLRNAACPCGSGKKYKHCHGELTTETV
jgi:preprotein translocase subunit SecA